MSLGRLITWFETSPALRLLRSSNAPFILDFLGRQFKTPGRIAVPHSELHAGLLAYQDDLRETNPGALPSRAEAYLAEWCSPDALWLRRFLEAGRDEAVYQLTPHTEDVFAFLDRVLADDLGFVGTESRLKLVIDTLADLVLGASDDPERRLAHLREEQRRLQDEIDRIEADGRVTRYQPAQIRDRFQTAVTLLRQLQGDFRAVEESFRDITRQVQQRQAQGADTRGGILAYALDAEDLLEREDQGVSFYEFVKLVLSPSQTERLERIIQDVRRVPELQALPEGLDTVRGMVGVLQAEADKVMRTNQRLSAALRRLLDARAHAERQRIAQLLRDIRDHAVTLAADPPRDAIGLALDLEPDIDSPLRRGFWSEGARFDEAAPVVYEADAAARLEAFGRLAAMHRLDWRAMRQRIRRLVADRGAGTLAELLDAFPPDGGVIEVLGYLQIAHDDGHLVNRRTTQEVVVPATRAGDPDRRLTVPLVTFTARQDGPDGPRPA
jgi:hypothetical protein